MWSGPRNISTAMMRAWENRDDTAVVDEPLYAHYLAHTGLDHPGREEIVAEGETDWRAVVEKLTGPVPDKRAIYYQKHMAHHLLEHIDRHWLEKLTHCFLIRHPREVVLSYIKARPEVTPEDLGYPQQAAILEALASSGVTPLIIDAAEFLKAPAPMLRMLCERLDIAFDDAMLSWPAGPRNSDGIWAKYWYEAVEKSTGFAPYRRRTGEVPIEHAGVVEACMPIYEALYDRRLRI